MVKGPSKEIRVYDAAKDKWRTGSIDLPVDEANEEGHPTRFGYSVNSFWISRASIFIVLSQPYRQR